jgi:hypothetical protein
MLQTKGKVFTQIAEDFRKDALEDESVLASVQIGMSNWLLTNQRLVRLSMMGRIKAATPLSSIQSVRMNTDAMALDQFYMTERGGSEIKLGSVTNVGKEFLELFESTLGGVAHVPEEENQLPQSESKSVEIDPKEQKRLIAEQKKADRAEAKEKKQEAEQARKAQELAKYGREVLSEMLGLKTVKFYEHGFTKVGMLGDFEKLMGIEGSGDNLQKKSAAGRAAGFVFTGGLNMLGSNKRGDLLITITTDSNVHTLHVDAPYEHDLKSYQRIVAVGKSLLDARGQREQNNQAPAPQSISGEIEKLVSLKEAGVLTDEEFASAKRRLLEA